MRLRWQRRVRKQLRRMRGHERILPVTVAKFERRGLPLVDALRAVMLDPARFHLQRAAIGKLLAVAGDGEAVQALMGLFYEQTEKDELYATALTLESLNDRRAVPPLIHALLEDGNPHRRRAAARALGWIRQPGRTAALALAGCLVDPSQPQPVREEAAESLAYVGTRETIEALISVLRDPDVRIRFWAVFGLGGSCRGDMRAVRALESVLDDGETPPGNWWPVGKEALAMLASKQPSAGNYSIKLAAERQQIISDPNATTEDRRWATFYSDICEVGTINTARG
jgi:HEAT repeat protein